MKRDLVARSKFLSLVLRHDPGVIGLSLDPNGWADVDELLSKAAARGTRISRDELEEIVATNEKKRFDLDAGTNRIRANQGHSIEVDLELEAAVPPELLYHGSADRNTASILEQGIIKGNRQHVHLSSDVPTARNVGSRHGRPVVLEVASGEMNRKGLAFFLSKNGVWLTEHVPAEFVRLT